MGEKERIWILVNPTLCSGCRLCEVACSLKHEGVIWPEASRIRIFEFLPGANVPQLCSQCPSYPCVSACRFDALSIDRELGYVVVNEDKCTGCGECIEVCPGHIPRIPKGKNVVVICDLCGGEPECVKVCNEAGYGALKIVKGPYRDVYETFASDPIKKSKEIAKKMYEVEV